MGVIIFNGIASTDYDIQVETYPNYETPLKDYESVHVPGRNGDIYISSDSYKNVNRTYEISVASLKPNQYTNLANGVSEWLHSSIGYARLEDSYEPEYYRMAVYDESFSLENILNHGGKTTINFNCKPQRFLKSGDKPLIFHRQKTTQEEKVEYLGSMMSNILASIPYIITFNQNIIDLTDAKIEYTWSDNTPIEDRLSLMEELISIFNNRIHFKISFDGLTLNIANENRSIASGGTVNERIKKISNAFAAINSSIPFKIIFSGTSMLVRDDNRVYVDPKTGLESSSLPEYKPYSGIIQNPTNFNALPIIIVKGSGSGELSIGDYKVFISNIDNFIVIDGELQDCYQDQINKNYDVSLPNGFPVLKSGNNDFSFGGGITSVEVIPKWWTL